MTLSRNAREAISLDIRRKGLTPMGIKRSHGYSNAQISRCLKAEGRLELGMLEKLADLFGCDLEITLVKREDEG